MTIGLLSAGILGTLYFPSRAALSSMGFFGLANEVKATGSAPGTALEDRIEVQWSMDDPVPVTSSFHVYRGGDNTTGDLVHLAASTESLFEDWSVVPNVPYEYCVYVATNGSETLVASCVTGMRVIARPTNFQATDGALEEQVRLTWADQSQIEGGFNVYRDLGNALAFDGTNDWIATQGIVDLEGSYSFEFWAKRASIGTQDFVVNLEVNPNGDPVDVDLEIGFLADNRFAVAFGTNVLATDMLFDVVDEWHHFAFAFDAPNRRRIIYVDGEARKFDTVPSAMAPTGDLEFGRRTKNGSTSSRGHFHGQIDEIRQWNVALTEDQVRDRRSAILTGAEPGLIGYWAFDAAGGGVASDFFGEHPGTLVDMAPDVWVQSTATAYRAEVPADFTAYADRMAVPGFEYAYEVAAYQDMDGSGSYTPGDFESERRTDMGFRGFLTPPGAVAATDGEFVDRVRVTWADMTGSEEGYRVYRDAILLASLPSDTELYDDLAPAGTAQYCVEAYAGTSTSNLVCDEGHAGDLQPPVSVTATDGEHDDKVVISWEDVADSEDEFEILRDGLLIATTEADATNFADMTAVQNVQYEYCVVAVSKSDPLQEVRSDQNVACDFGTRAIILDPTELTATVDEFEDRVELDWSNPSTTALLFELRRDGQLIEVLDFNTTAATDTGIPSDTEITYEVRAATVVVGASIAQQGQVAQILEQIQISNAIAEQTGEMVLSPQATLQAVYAELGLDVAGKDASATSSLEYSNPIEAVGSRSIHPPTAAEATIDEFENHVQIDWEDNSEVETGYRIYRTPQDPAPGIESLVATLSPNRTTYGDYTGIPGMPYLYRVEAIDEYVPDEGTGLVVQGFSASATALGKRTLKPPALLIASDGTSEEIVYLDWEDNSAAETGYRIYRRTVGAPAWGPALATTGKNEPAYEDDLQSSGVGLLGVDLEYKVVAYDPYGESLPAIDVGHTMLEAPANVNASEVYASSVVVVWVDRSNVEDGYVVTRREFGAPVASAVVVSGLDPLPAGTTLFTESPDPGLFVYCVYAVYGTTVKSASTCDEGGLSGALAGGGGGGGGVGDPVPFRIDRGNLTNDTGVGQIRFGTSVAADASGRGLVGAPGGFNKGAVVEFSIDAENTWTPTGTFTPIPPGGVSSYGRAVDVNGDYLSVGAANGYYLYGAAPTAVPTVGGTERGASVATVNGWMIVGDPAASSGAGSAFVCRDGAAACAVLPVGLPAGAPLDIPALAAGEAFGTAVDLTIVSRSWTDLNTEPDPDPSDNVNHTADFLVAIVGAPGGGQDKSRALIFECPLSGPGAAAVPPPADQCEQSAHWSVVAEVKGQFSGLKDNTFGETVSVYSDVVVVGDGESDGFEVWKETTEDENTGLGSWDQTHIVSRPIDNTRTIDRFAAAVSIRGDIIVVGAPYTDHKNPARSNSGAIFVYSLADLDRGEKKPRIDYDARTGSAGELPSEGFFGSSVAIGDAFYLVGAPGEADGGAAYSIPFDFEPVKATPEPEVAVLDPATGVAASDGTAPDRIQVRWTDNATDETGQIVYRSREGGELERLAEISADIVFYDDFSASPGDAYTYCVTAYTTEGGEIQESASACDIGWRPANGTIAGLVAPAGGGATEDVEVCLAPSPNNALLLDGARGHLEAIAGEESPMPANFTLEFWFRQHGKDIDEHFLVVRDSALALSVVDGDLRISTWEVTGGKHTFPVETNLEPGVWHHVAITRGTDNRTTVFVAGNEVDSEDRSLLLDTEAAGDSIRIGRNGFDSGVPGTPEPDGYFRGEIDELRLWSKARTEEEIQSDFMGVLIGDEEALVGYWPLDQGKRRVAPDVSESAMHGVFIDGAYIADLGAPVKVCGITDEEGQYSIGRIRYEETTEFKVTPRLGSREFEPAFQKVTLATDSPVQNQIFFVDKTAYTVAGVVQYADTEPYAYSCPAPDVGIFLSKDGILLESTLRATSGEDGSFALAVDPSDGENDRWYFTPDFNAAEGIDADHTFWPEFERFAVSGDRTDLVFVDQYRNTFSGAITGGDPETCHKDIGVALVRVYTQDGCFNYEFEVDTGEMNDGVYGGFSLDLPPLDYLVEVVEVTGGPDDERATDFFRRLGTIEIDLTEGDVERNLTYRAPLVLAVQGLEPPSQCEITGIQQLDEDDSVIRTLPSVATLGEWEFRELTITVTEDYGAEGTCPVEEGTVTIFDAVSDRVDADSTVALKDGIAKYTVIGTTPNIYSGARIGGVDRSFQKPFTVVAQVEGVPTMQTTEWALVEGFRERSATFVSATTERFPLLILHDPPGSNSYAFLEQGISRCTTLSNTMTLGGSGGLSTELIFGYTGQNLVAPFGVGVGLEAEVGWKLSAGFTVGGSNTSLQSGRPNRQVCVTTTKGFTTSNDMTWVGEDIHVGAALNLIFAIADVVDVDDQDVCKITKYEKLAADINEANPFETAYVYGKSHIALSLIPELENLIRLAGGDAAITGDIKEVETTIPLVDALDNWNAQLRNSRNLQEAALADPIENRSFSGGTEFRWAEGKDSTDVTYLNSTKVYFNVDFSTGPLFGFSGNESNVMVNLGFNSEWIFEEQRTTGGSDMIGYVLSDGDTGDYFSVDVAKNPRYGTFVFGTRSGRSSNPWEGNTQKRDNPIITVDPPVLYNVDPDDAGRFELTLINGSESFERRQYTLGVPGETNPRNLGLTVTGDLLGGNRLESFLLDPGKALTINMDVFASPSAFSYHRVGVMLYPETEFNIWKADPRQPFALSDTAFFSVFFDSTGGNTLARVMDEGWNWVSINRPESEIGDVLANYPAEHGDLIQSFSEEARFDSTAGWVGPLKVLRPGEAYQARLQKAGLLRMKGDPVDTGLTIPLRKGWSWVGYLPAKSMPIADALVSLQDRIIEGDLVVGQRGFAQYTNRAGWVGTLEDMAPGEAYQLYIAGGGDLVYPKAPEVIEPRPPVAYETVASGPDWDVDEHGYTASMTMVAEVARDEVPLDQEAIRIAALSGDEVRGVGDVRHVAALDRYVAFIQVFGPVDEEEELRVHVFDGETGELYQDVGTVQYAPQSMLGQAAAPVMLDLANAGLAPDLRELPDEFELYPNYPNPFNPVTVIGYDLPESGRVTLTVYDVLGRRVADLVNEEQTAGRYRILFDARQYASGVYLYRLNVGNFTKVGKMMLVK